MVVATELHLQLFSVLWSNVVALFRKYGDNQSSLATAKNRSVRKVHILYTIYATLLTLWALYITLLHSKGKGLEKAGQTVVTELIQPAPPRTAQTMCS